MRLLVATPLYPPEPGGPATYAKLLEERLPQQGIRVKVVPFSLVRHHAPVVRHIVYSLMLARYAGQADVIFVQDTFSTGAPAALVAWIFRKPLILRVPGDYAWEQGTQRFGVTDGIDSFQKTRYGMRVEILRMVQKFVARRADIVITPSTYFTKIVSGWGVEPSRLRTIYNGIDMSMDAEEPGNMPTGRILVTIGRLTPWKGFDMLIELMEELPDWTLVIVGDGPQRQELKRKALMAGVANRVIFTGAVSRARMFGWCQVSDAFALNTSFESFSFQVVEAMHAGIPVITTTAGSLPEIVENGAEGILCAPGDKIAFVSAIKSVLSEPDQWRSRTKRAREKAGRFSIDSTLEQLTTEIRSLV